MEIMSDNILKNKGTIRVATGKRVIFDFPGLEFREVEYTSSWFERSKTKPRVELKASNTTLNEMRGIVKSGIIHKNLGLDCAKYYLYLVLKDVKNKLNEDWTSYGIQIGRKNSEICPWDILNISVVDGLATDETSEDATFKDDLWMVIYILSMYRLLSITNIDHRKSVISRIIDQMKIADKTFIFSAMMEAAPTYTYWLNNRDYRKMIAAVDMFFTRFASNSWATVKIGTISSRFYGCGGLLAIEHMQSMLGLSLTELKQWIWTENTAKDINRMMRDDEEIGEEFSYFPYQLDLGLVSKTAYSATVNESIFFLAHATCALLGSERSKNANYNFETNVMSTITNVKIIAYAFSEKLLNRKKTVSQGTASGIPLNTDAIAWLKFMRKRNCDPPEDMLAFIMDAKNKIGAVRNKTIGKYVKETF